MRGAGGEGGVEPSCSMCFMTFSGVNDLALELSNRCATSFKCSNCTSGGQAIIEHTY